VNFALNISQCRFKCQTIRDAIIPIRYQSTPPLKGEGSTDDVSPFPFREGGRGVRCVGIKTYFANIFKNQLDNFYNMS